MRIGRAVWGSARRARERSFKRTLCGHGWQIHPEGGAYSLRTLEADAAAVQLDVAFHNPQPRALSFPYIPGAAEALESLLSI
jgi:hypothetical protein